MTLLCEDRALLAEFRAGEARALERVYRHYVPAVAALLARGFLVSREKGPTMSFGLSAPFELENAVQEVFVRAFSERARSAYDGLRPYRDFLFGIAKHVAIDELRRRHRRPTVPLDTLALEPELEDPAESAEDALVRQRASEVVADFLKEECDDRDRHLYGLRFVEDQSQDSAAQKAGLTRIQVRRWETKLRARLLRHLKRIRYV